MVEIINETLSKPIFESNFTDEEYGDEIGLDALEIAGMPSEFARKVLNVFVDPNDLSPQVNIGYLFNSNVGNYMKDSALTIDN